MKQSLSPSVQQLHLHEFKVSQHDFCEIMVTILPESNSEGQKHKVKIAGVTISEEGGAEGLKNNMAIDMVMEGVSAGNTSHKNFEMRTWGRLKH